MRRLVSKKRRLFEGFLLLVAGAGFAVWAWAYAGGAIYQDWESWSFDQQMLGRPHGISDYLAARHDRLAARVRHLFGAEDNPNPQVAQSPTAPPRNQQSSAPTAPAVNSVIGRLSIPRLGVKAMVREGTGEGTLSLSLGHIPGTALPGQNGNVGVAGHRDTSFRKLAGIQADDRIHIETLHGNYVYEVDGRAIVGPDDISVLHPGARPELTLVTCYPFDYIGAAPQRFIVKAHQVVDLDLPPTPQPAAIEAPPKRRARPPSYMAATTQGGHFRVR
jgi:sortase A